MGPARDGAYRSTFLLRIERESDSSALPGHDLDNGRCPLVAVTFEPDDVRADWHGGERERSGSHGLVVEEDPRARRPRVDGRAIPGMPPCAAGICAAGAPPVPDRDVAGGAVFETAGLPDFAPGSRRSCTDSAPDGFAAESETWRWYDTYPARVRRIVMDRNGRPVSVIGVLPRSVSFEEDGRARRCGLHGEASRPRGSLRGRLLRTAPFPAGPAASPVVVSGGAAALAAGLAVAPDAPPRAGSTAAAAGGGAGAGVCAG